MAAASSKRNRSVRADEHRERVERMKPVCELIADGQSLKSICAPEKIEADPSLPNRTMVLRWVNQYPDIRDMYVQARGIGTEVWGDELMDIAHKTLAGKYDPNAAKVSADITKWTLARLAPRKWSDRAIDESFNRQANIEQGDNYGGIPADLVAPDFANFFRDVRNHRYTHFREYGGRGSLKSTSISLAFIDLMMTNPGLHGFAARQVGNTIRDSVFAQLVWAIDELGLRDQWKVNKSILQLTRIDTDQRIYFRGLDEPSKIKSIKPPFGYIGISWIEEADQAKGEEALRPVRQSIIRGGDKFWWFESWNTPRNKQHWINVRTAEETGRAEVRTHHSCYLSAPEEWLGPDFFIEANALKSRNEKAYRHEYLGEAVGSGGEVFEFLSLEMISDESMAAFDNIRMGLDWGFSGDPLAWVKCHYDKRRKVLFIFDELVAVNLSDEEASRLLKARGVNRRDRIICDSADPKTISNYRNLGFNASGCRKYAGSVEHGVKWLQALEMIVIDPVRCPVAAREFYAYSYKQDEDGVNLPVLIQKNDHTIDAVRYAMDIEIDGQSFVMTN